MKDNKETYHISIDVQDANGKYYKDKDGNKRTEIKAELSFDKDANYSHGIKGALKSHMTQMGKTMMAWVPEGSIVSVEASVPNSISNTYMVMHSYYANEDRFVNH